MPTLTTAVMRLPVWPVHRPSRTRSANSAMRSSTACTSATTSTPSTTSWASRGSRSAVWSTARSSVELMWSPRNIAARRSPSPDSSARATSRSSVSSVARCFDRSAYSPAASTVIRSPRPGSSANSSRRCSGATVAWWSRRAWKEARRRRGVVTGVMPLDASWSASTRPGAARRRSFHVGRCRGGERRLRPATWLPAVRLSRLPVTADERDEPDTGDVQEHRRPRYPAGYPRERHDADRRYAADSLR